MVDYDRDHRSYDFRYTSAAGDHRAYGCGAVAGDYDRGYRNELRPYGALAGDRRLEIVKGNVLSANQTYVTPPAPAASGPSPQPRFPPPAKKNDGGGAGAWCFSDREMNRRRRVASYKAYTVERKLKASLRKGFRWVKVKCSDLVHGL